MYQIKLVGDTALPGEHDFMLLDGPSGMDIAFRESALSAATLEAAWAAYRATADGAPPPRLTLARGTG